MADSKISDLIALTGAASATDDEFVIVDTSGVETKRMTRAELIEAVAQNLITLSTTGSVGIGTSSPDVFSRAYSGTTMGVSSASGETAFMINSSGTNVAAIELGRAGSRESMVYDTPTSFQVGSLTSKPLNLLTNGTTRVTVDSSGNVGIGMDPAEVLDLKATSGDTRIRLDAATGSDTEIKFFNNGVAQYTIGHDDATDNFVIGTTNVDAPLVSVDKSGNFGIGTNSPSADLQINDGNTTRGVAGTLHMYGSAVNGDAGDVSNEIFFRDESVSNWGGAFIRTVRPADDQNGKDDLTFGTSPTGGSVAERMRIDSSGNVGIGTSSPTVPLHVSGKARVSSLTTTAAGDYSTNHVGVHASGITVNAATGQNGYIMSAGSSCLTFGPSAASIQLGGFAAANKLDDYETGTWTPVMTYETPGDSVITFSTQTGRYTKVGRMVTLHWDIRLSGFTKGTASGNPSITGIPFANTSSDAYGKLVPYNAPFTLQPFVQVLTSSLRCQQPVSNSSTVAMNDPDANSIYFGTVTYSV
jgi:hypothetical protein